MTIRASLLILLLLCGLLIWKAQDWRVPEMPPRLTARPFRFIYCRHAYGGTMCDYTPILNPDFYESVTSAYKDGSRANTRVSSLELWGVGSGVTSKNVAIFDINANKHEPVVMMCAMEGVAKRWPARPDGRCYAEGNNIVDESSRGGQNAR